jgi:hypothetical protein
MARRYVGRPVLSSIFKVRDLLNVRLLRPIAIIVKDTESLRTVTPIHAASFRSQAMGRNTVRLLPRAVERAYNRIYPKGEWFSMGHDKKVSKTMTVNDEF